MSYKRKELFTLRDNLISRLVLGGVRVADRFSFLCCVMFLCLAGFHPLICVPNGASISGLSIFDCLRFSLAFI